MERCESDNASGDAGYLMIEAVIAVALVALVAGAVLAAVVAVTHANAHALPAPALSATAQNVLTDLRAATAYDPQALGALAGKSAAFDAVEPGPNGSNRIVHVVTSVARSGATDAFTATVTVSSDAGARVTLESTLVQEAPAPGSVLPAGTPTPSPSPAGADDAIQL